MEYYIHDVNSEILKPFEYHGLKTTKNKNGKDERSLKAILDNPYSRNQLVNIFLKQLEDVAEKKPDFKLSIVKDSYSGIEKIVSEGHNLFPFTQSQVSAVISEEGGTLLYRGHPIKYLVNEDPIKIASLLIMNQVDKKSVQLVKNKVQLCSELPLDVIDYLIREPLEGLNSPMSVLRTAISMFGTFEEPINIGSYNLSDKEQKWILSNKLIGRALDIAAKIPAITSYLKNIWDLRRMERGLTKEAILERLVRSDPSLEPIPNFINMFYLDGEVNSYSLEAINAFYITHMSHGMNASSHAGMLLSSAEATFYAAMTASVGALSGLKHGGASNEVISQWKFIKENLIRRDTNEKNIRAKVKDYISKKIDQKIAVAGLAHGEYKKGDPRSKILREYVNKLIKDDEGRIMYVVADQIARTAYEKKGLHPNVDFWASQLLYLLNVPEGFNPMFFAAARSYGWIANNIEQIFRVGKLNRPTEVWTGPVYADGLQNTLKSTQTL